MTPRRATTRLTAAGRVLVPVALFGFLAAWAQGGIPGLLAATACSLLLLAPGLARLHTGGLEVGAPPPGRVHVGDGFVLRVPVANRGTWFRARHLTVACAEVGEARDDDPWAGQVVDLGPGEETVVEVFHRLHTRGRHRALRMVVSSTFPLGVVRRALVFDVPADLLALPRLGSLRDLTRLPRGRRQLVRAARYPDPGDEELDAVRDWREGESLRRVHWRLSARRGRRVVREMRHPNEPPVHLVLATGVPPRLPVGSSGRSFERSVSLAATVGEHYLRRGRELRLSLAGQEGSLGPIRGRGGLLRLLTALADVRATDRGDDELGADIERALARGPGRLREELRVAVCAGRGAVPSLPGEDGLLLDVDAASTDAVFSASRHWGTGVVAGRMGGVG